MSVLATMVSLICLSFIFEIDTKIGIRPRKKGTTGTNAAKICKTKNCVDTAETIKKKMNLSADPCVDFNEYACGRFLAETVFHEGRTRVGPFDIVSNENNLIMKDIIVQNIKKTEPRYLQNMKRLYKSCINEAKIEKIGLTPYLKDRQFVDDWPTLNQNWKESSFNLNDVIARYEKVFIQPLFKWTVSAHMKDSNKNAIYLDVPDLSLQPEYFLRPRNDPVIMAYQKYLAEVAVVLGADRNVAELDAKGVIDLKIALSKVKVSREEKRDSSIQFNPVELVKLNELYHDIDIPRALRDAFDTANIILPDNEIVINSFPTYIGNLSLVIKKFPKRTVQNLFGFTYAISKVQGLTKKLRKLLLDVNKVYVGMTTEDPRWVVCLIETSRVFRMGMSKEYVKRKFTESDKVYINQMIDNLEGEFKKMLHENTWMGQATKDEAYKKLVAIKRKIGYPDKHFQESDIEKMYEKYTMVEDNYYANILLHDKLDNLKVLFQLRTPVNEWYIAPYETNAFYTTEKNEMGFPAGFLQPPFFSKTFQDSMNYGAIGAVIGHEITHGFDDQGSQYDAHGILRNWWQKSDLDNFVQRTQCFIDQTSKFYVPDINMTLKGINLQGESVGDNGGLKESFRAYKELVRKNGEHPKLKGLNLTQDQLFFLAFAQVWCEKSTRETLIAQVTLGFHPPGKYRVIGPLQNSEDFAKAYNCPRGSNMNPDKKCSIW